MEYVLIVHCNTFQYLQSIMLSQVLHLSEIGNGEISFGDHKKVNPDRTKRHTG